MRILVVEESFETRELVAQILTEDGHEVTLAQWAEDALEIYRKAPFPVVITEIAMRSMSGIELLKKIKQICPDTEVIILTSYASIDTAVAALRSGAYDYLIKPIEGISLISSVVNRTIEKISLVTQNRTLMDQLRRENRELKELNHKLNSSRALDDVTGLFKASYFQEALEVELDRARNNRRIFSLILLEVTSAPEARKQPCGSPDGDNIRRMLSNCVKNNLRRSDLIALYGEMGFAALLPETPKEGARYVADKISGRLQNLIWPEHGAERLVLGVSLGVATFPEDGEDGSTLVRLACQSLNPEQAS